MATLERQLDELYKDYEKAQNMNEEECRKAFNVDSKREFIAMLTEEIDRIEDEMTQEQDAELEGGDPWNRLDPAFSSWQDVDGMFTRRIG